MNPIPLLPLLAPSRRGLGIEVLRERRGEESRVSRRRHEKVMLRDRTLHASADCGFLPPSAAGISGFAVRTLKSESRQSAAVHARLSEAEDDASVTALGTLLGTTC